MECNLFFIFLLLVSFYHDFSVCSHVFCVCTELPLCPRQILTMENKWSWPLNLDPWISLHNEKFCQPGVVWVWGRNNWNRTLNVDVPVSHFLSNCVSFFCASNWCIKLGEKGSSGMIKHKLKSDLTVGKNKFKRINLNQQIMVAAFCYLERVPRACFSGCFEKPP